MSIICHCIIKYLNLISRSLLVYLSDHKENLENFDFLQQRLIFYESYSESLYRISRSKDKIL